MPNLFELSAEFRQLADELAEYDLDPDTLRDTLDGLAYDLEKKVLDLARVALDLEAQAKARKEAAKAMTARANRAQANADRIRDYMRQGLLNSNWQSAKDGELEVDLVRNAPALVEEDARRTPGELMVQPDRPEPRPNRAEILNTLKAGTSVPGWKLKQDKRLRIR